MKDCIFLSRTRPLGVLAWAVLVALWCGIFPASAALRLWTGGGPNGFWSTPANWNPAGPPLDGDDLGFVAGMPRQTSTNDLVGRSFHSFIFNGAGANYTLFGNSVTLSAGVNTLGTAGGSLNFPLVTLAADQEFIADGANFNASSDVALNGHTLTMRATTSNSFVSVIGSISGVGDVVKVGVGQGLFGGPEGNTYRGTLYVTEGIMLLGKGNGGNGLAVPGNLEIGSHIDLNNDPFIFGKVVLLRANMITNTGTLTINHGSLNQNGFDLVVGPLELYDGGINTSNATLIPIATISQPSWPYTRYPFISGHVSLPFDITFDLRQPGPLSIDASVSGIGGIIQNGYGTLTLYNTNDFTGAVTVNGGILYVNESTQALGQNPVVTLNQDGLLGLEKVTINNKTLTLTSRDAGIIAIYEPCAWTGPINLNFIGQAQVTAGGVFGGDFFTSLRLTGPIHGTGGLKFGGKTNELTGNNDFTGDVTSACELLKLNTGALRPFTGSLEIGGGFNTWGFDYGELDFAETNPICEVRWTDSAFQLVPHATIRTNGWANLNGHDNEFGSLDMTGGLISSGGGKLYLDGPVTTHPAPMTALIEGLLQLSTFPAVRFDVADSPVDPDLRITAVISDGVPSGIDKEGDGELLLTAANTYRQLTTVGGGVLHIQNDTALGTTAGTTVLDGATLYNETSATLAEPLTLSGAGRGGTNGALFLGPATGVQSGIVLAGGATVRNDSSFAILSGAISGTGPFTKTGAGTLQFGGSSGPANTYSGDTVVANGILVPFKGTGVITIPGHLIIGTGNIGSFATVRHFSGFTIGGSVTVNRGSLWDLNGQAEGFSVPALQGRAPLTLLDGGDVQTGAGFVYLPVGGDVVVNPGFAGSASSSISGNLGLDPGPHRFIVGSHVTILGGPECQVSAAISETSTAADVVKDGFGALLLAGANSFSGTMTVNSGTLILSNNAALGTTAGGTFVSNNAAIYLSGGVFVGAEPLTLNSTAQPALDALTSFNGWAGAIQLSRDTALSVDDPGGVLSLSGALFGPGGFTKLGGGGLNLAGASANTYTGTTIVSNGVVEVNKPGGTRAVSGNVIIGDGVNPPVNAGLRVFDPGHLPRTANVLVRQSGLFDVNAAGAVLGGLTGSGNLNLAGPLTVSNSVSCVFDGAVSGSGALNKLGLATLRFTGNGSAYTGPATVFDGTYKVDGHFPSSPVTVKVSSLLRGNGTVGDVTVENGGVVKVDPSAPGQLSGEMVMNSANFLPGGVLGLGFYGPHATGGNDSLFVNNAVTLTSPTLSSGFQYPPHEGDVITLISKDAAGAVSGAFSGFPEGAARIIGNIPVVMSYVGGNGNDVTLTVSGLPLQSGGAQILSGNDGGVFVPNDCSLLTLVVTNRGSTTISNLHGTLRSLTPGVVVTIPESTFPNLAPNAPGSNATPFQIRTEETFPCGSGAQFELVLTASNLPPTAINYTFAGGSGFGLAFNGGDDRVDVRTNLFLRVTNNFTIELWANPAGNRAETVERNTGIAVGVRPNQRFAVFPDRGDLSYGPAHVGAGLSIGRNGISVFESGSNYFPTPLVYSNAVSGWTHVALVYNNRRPRLYVNGVLARTGLLSPAPFIHASAGLGGSIHGIGFGNFAGQLDEVRIWNTALSETQIQTNMLRTLAGSESGLVVYYPCDEGQGTTLTDSAPASPNVSGTLVNGAAFVFPGVVPFPLPDGVDCNAGGGACESCLVVSGRFTADVPVIAQRLNFTGSPSVCYPPKPCPDLDPLPDLVPDLPPVRNLVHGFANPTTNELCVTAQLHFDCPAAPFGSLGIAAYLGSFNPAQPCANYLGDGGGGGPPYPPFSFRVPAGSNFAVVVTARDTNLACDTYTMELFGLPCPPPTLHIAKGTTPGKVLLQWSSAYPGYRLQSTGALPVSGPAAFSNVTVSPVLVGGKFAVSNSVAAPRQFFRLKSP